MIGGLFHVGVVASSFFAFFASGYFLCQVTYLFKFIKKFFKNNSSEKTYSTSKMLFGFTFALSCLIFEFIIFELMNIFPVE
jgi:hypothetical protein